MPELDAFQPYQGSVSSLHSQEIVVGKGPVQNGNVSDTESESNVSEYRDDTQSMNGSVNGSVREREQPREIPTVLNVVAAVLERLVARNERLGGNLPVMSPLNQRKLTSFHGLRAPGISISKYMERIFKYTNCSQSCFVVGYVFIDRLIHKQPDMPVTSLNVHRLIVTCVMVAAKMLDDV
jgi:hypothetical protein